MSDAPNSASSPKRKTRWIWTGYLLLVHLILIAVIFRPSLVHRMHCVICKNPAVFDHYQGIVAGQVVQSRCLPQDCVVFLGDSIVAALDVERVVDCHAMNFGIGGDTTAGLLWRMPQYSNLDAAKAVVVSIGINDLSHFDDDAILESFKRILESLPTSVPVVVSAILPLNEAMFVRPNISYLSTNKASNDRIRAINQKLEQLCQTFSNTVLANAHDVMVNETGNLRQDFTRDGIHLTIEGYNAWAGVLKSGLSEVLAR